jgi:hypothetical protein
MTPRAEIKASKADYVLNHGLSVLDEYGCLKVPFLLILAMVYLARHPLVPLAVFAAGGKNGPMSYLLDASHLLLYISCSIPALAVLLAWNHRLPAGRAVVRWIWARGQWLLLLAALSDMAVRLYLTENLLKGLAIAQLLLDGYVIFYIFISVRVRDVFAEFPAPEEPTQGEPP